MKKAFIIIVITVLAAATAFFAYKYFSLAKITPEETPDVVIDDDRDEVFEGDWDDVVEGDENELESAWMPHPEFVETRWRDISWQGPFYDDEEVQTFINEYAAEIGPPSQYSYAIDRLMLFVDIADPYWAFCEPALTENSKENFINKIFTLIGRDNNRLLKTYKRFRPVIFRTINQDIFDEFQMEKYLHLLDLTYYAYCDEATEEFELDYKILEKMYRELDNNDGSNYESMMNVLGEYDVPYYGNEDEEKSLIFWAYSFWPRRYREGNLNAVKIILDDLKSRYITFNQDDSRSFKMLVGNDNISKDKDGNLSFQIKAKETVYHYQFDSSYKRTGKWKADFLHQGYRAVCDMKNDVNDGFFEFYNENGICEIKYPFKNGVKEGETFYKEYDLEKIEHWKNGKRNGIFTEKEGGRIVKEGNYIDDELHGEYREYYSNGKLHLKSIYNHGELVESKLYNSNGEEITPF